MRVRFGFALYTAVVVVFGILTLAGLLVGDGSAFGEVGTLLAPLNDISSLFIRLVVVVIALTLVIGIFNLLSVHATRLVRGPGTGARLNSLVLLISFLLALVAYQTSTEYNLLLENVQVQIELALAALICFALVYGAFRLLHKRVTWGGLVFLAGMLVILIGALPIPPIGTAATSDRLVNPRPLKCRGTRHSIRYCIGHPGDRRARHHWARSNIRVTSRRWIKVCVV